MDPGPLTGELPRVSLDDTGGPPRPRRIRPIRLTLKVLALVLVVWFFVIPLIPGMRWSVRMRSISPALQRKLASTRRRPWRRKWASACSSQCWPCFCLALSRAGHMVCERLLAWRDGEPARVLSLRWPRFTGLGWGLRHRPQLDERFGEDEAL